MSIPTEGTLPYRVRNLPDLPPDATNVRINYTLDTIEALPDGSPRLVIAVTGASWSAAEPGGSIGDPCTSCGLSYADCQSNLRDAGMPCCMRCSNTDTHNLRPGSRAALATEEAPSE